MNIFDFLITFPSETPTLHTRASWQNAAPEVLMLGRWLSSKYILQW